MNMMKELMYKMSNQKNIAFVRSIPVKYETDVFVAGGGPAGVAAALAAVSNGASVYLAESQDCFGGAGTAGLVPAFMEFTNGVDFLAAGIGEKIFNKLGADGGSDPNKRISIRVEVLKRVYDDLMAKSGVDFTFHTQLVAVEAANGNVSHVILSSKSGIFAAKAKIYIDCTGDGDLATWAGAPFEKGNANGIMMAGTLCSLWAGIEWDKVVKPDSRKLEEAFDMKIFTIEDRHLPGMWRTGERLGGGNIGHTYGVDGTDERSLTEALIKGRNLVKEYERYYKEFLDGYDKMELAATGSILGIRETRRIMGDYILNLADFNSRATFDDEIGRYSYPVDIHASKSGLESYKEFRKERESFRYKKGESYGIPYRSLLVKGLSNILTAGRCISTDRYMQSSIRVMPGCYITGQAAGAAAAIAVHDNTDTRGFDIYKLQKMLVSMGGYLPNFK